jgi:sulfur relay (sulfurtransferase) DsrC/TusE family protein
MLRGVTEEKEEKNGRLLETWYLGVFQKKLGTKLFIFTVKFFFHFNLFLLSFGPRVHFRSQTWTFLSNTPEYKFQSKTVKLLHFTLEKSFFFIFNQFFFHSYQSCPMLRGVTEEKQKKTGHLLGTWYLGVFQKKLEPKLFIFTLKKIHSNLFLLSFGPRVHFRSQTLTFWSNTPEYKFQSKTVKLSHFTLEKSFFFIFNQCFFHSYQSCPMLRGVTKKEKKTVAYWKHGIWGFSKKN